MKEILIKVDKFGKMTMKQKNVESALELIGILEVLKANIIAPTLLNKKK